MSRPLVRFGSCAPGLVRFLVLWLGVTAVACSDDDEKGAPDAAATDGGPDQAAPRLDGGAGDLAGPADGGSDRGPISDAATGDLRLAPDTTPDAPAEVRLVPTGMVPAGWSMKVITIAPTDGGVADGGADGGRPYQVRGASGYEATTGTFGLEANGRGIDRKRYEEELNFLSQPLKGDGEVYARLTGFDGCKMGSAVRGGLMLREGVDSDAAFVAAMISPAATLAAQDGRMVAPTNLSTIARRGKGYQSERTFTTDDPKLPVTVRLTRRGNTVAVAYAVDPSASNFAAAGEVSFPSLAETVNVGLFAASSETGQQTSESCRAFFEAVRVKTPLLPAPWDYVDIENAPSGHPPGQVALPAGAPAGALNAVTVTGNGIGLADGADPGFTFAFRPVNGSVEMIARLVELKPEGAGAISADAKAGLMLRTTLAARSINLFIWQRPQQAEMVKDPQFDQATIVTTNRRADNDGIKPIWTGTEEVKPPVWLRLVRDYRDLDRIYTFYSKKNADGPNPKPPTDEADWTVQGVITGKNDGNDGRKEMIGTGFVGFAVAAGNEGRVVARFDGVAVNPSPVIPPGGWMRPNPPDAGAVDASPGN